MRLVMTPPAQPNPPTGDMFAAHTSESPSPVAATTLKSAGHQSLLAISLAPYSSGGPAKSMPVAQLPAASSCLLGGCTPPPLHTEASGRTFRAHEPYERAYLSSSTSMAMVDAAHNVPTTSTDGFCAGANGPRTVLTGEPPRHTRPLYSHIPLPYEHVNLHPALEYEVDAEWDIPSSPLGADSRHWPAPATSPPRGCLTIVLPLTSQRMTVCPSSSPSNPHCGIVTVWDVLIAVEMVMSRLDNSDDTCVRGYPRDRRMTTRGRRCICKGDVPSLEYLRQRYGRAGLVKTRGDDDVWMLYVGHQ